MTAAIFWNRVRYTPSALLLLALFITFIGNVAGKAEERKVAGKCLTPTGTMIRREAPDKPWEIVKSKEDLHSGDLLVGLPGAMLASKNNAVRLAFLVDLEGKSPFPIKECAVVLHDNPAVDLDFTLDRGRADVQNTKEKGSATVRLHVRDQVWDLTLEEPGARVAFELYGRWPKGTQFTKNPKPTDVPVADLVILVIKGEVEVKHGTIQHAMHAPPGPAILTWDSISGEDATPKRLEKLPEWAHVAADIHAKDLVRFEAFRKLTVDKGIEAALVEFLDSNEPDKRRLALIGFAAIDDLPHLGKGIAYAKHADVLDNGILSLRHWIGRSPGQDMKLYNRLVDGVKFPPAHAVIILNLLHSFSDEQLARPELYEVLIDYLDHERLVVRALANWHLIRLAPEGKKIEFKPLDDKEKREEAIRQWKKLIPPGKLPPKQKQDGSK
jgi:hypothetical protein